MCWCTPSIRTPNCGSVDCNRIAAEHDAPTKITERTQIIESNRICDYCVKHDDKHDELGYCGVICVKGSQFVGRRVSPY